MRHHYHIFGQFIFICIRILTNVKDQAVQVRITDKRTDVSRSRVIILREMEKLFVKNKVISDQVGFYVYLRVILRKLSDYD